MIRDLWPWVAGLIVVIGLATQNGALAVLGFAVALVCAGAQLWARWSLRRLYYERSIPEDRAFPGEEIAVTLRMTNRKPLPLAWVEARDAFPESMVGDDPEGEFYFMGQPNQLGIDWRTSAGGYERISRSFRLHAPDRGVYELGPVTLRSGDPFGLFPEERTDTENSRVIVYPRTVDLGDLALPSRRPYGESPGGLRVFEDPSRVAGIRDYQSGDPLRRIDWNATARLGKLQSRVYDPSSSQHLLVCLNTATMTPSWAGYVPGLFERGITVAASIARDGHDRRYAVGLIATSSYQEMNTRWRHLDRADTLSALTYKKDVRDRADDVRFARARKLQDDIIRIPPGRRTEQLMRVLEALAVITPFVLDSLERMLDREEHRLAVGTTLAIVTPVMTGDLAATLERLRRRGSRIVVLSTSGDLWPEQLAAIDVRDMSWVDAPSAQFQPPRAKTETAEAAP